MFSFYVFFEPIFPVLTHFYKFTGLYCEIESNRTTYKNREIDTITTSHIYKCDKKRRYFRYYYGEKNFMSKKICKQF